MQNVREYPFVSKLESSVYVRRNGRKIYLPAYIPYIGPLYFEYRPRILCFAINQNLSPHVPWSEDWITGWATNMDHAYDRLNLTARKGQPIPIRPYAEGFIPLVALLALCRWNKTQGGYLPKAIEDVVAVTNFIKFSTAVDASSSNIPSVWWSECGSRYVEHEINVLRPDIIIGFGQKTVIELQRVLRCIHMSHFKTELLGCRFPARIPSIKSRPLSRRETTTWNHEIFPLISRISEPRRGSYHDSKIRRFPGYFIDVMTSWEMNRNNSD